MTGYAVSLQLLQVVLQVKIIFYTIVLMHVWQSYIIIISIQFWALSLLNFSKVYFLLRSGCAMHDIQFHWHGLFDLVIFVLHPHHTTNGTGSNNRKNKHKQHKTAENRSHNNEKRRISFCNSHWSFNYSMVKCTINIILWHCVSLF